MRCGVRWSGVALLAVLARLGAAPVTVSAGELTVSLDPADGYAISSLRHRASETELVAPRPAGVKQDRALWLLQLRDAAGQTRTVSATGLAADCSAADGGLKMVWREVGAALGADLTVTATATPRTDDIAWRIEVAGQAEGVLWQVDFPRLLGLRGLGDDQLALPEYLGRLVRQPADHTWRRLLVYPQPASMQFMAWWGSQDNREPELAHVDGRLAETGWMPYRGDHLGLYLAAEDGRGYYKVLGAQGGEVKGQFGWWLSHVPELATWPLPAGRQAVAYALPYEVVTAGFYGDWHEAAERYERWAAKQVWSARGPVGTWADELPDEADGRARFVPRWFRDIAFWGKFYFEPAKVLPELAAYRQWLGVPMASHWYRYTIAQFDDNYPEQLPADPYFREAVRMGRTMSVPTLPYTNGSIWDTDTQSWLREEGLAAALKDEAGGIYPWDIHGDIFAWMCPATAAWRAKIRETSHKLITEHGCPGVYLDVLVAGTPRPCYDPAHGHAIRGGNHYGAGNRRLLYELRERERLTDPEAAFFSEEIGELYNDLLDGHLTLDQLRSTPPPGEQVWPLFPAVYHPYTIYFGSDSSLETPLDQLAWEMGQMLIWGSQPL
ncbi:MAG: hypothetical protein HUU35_03560, partial [Armatimonadetes bacterium]|nr:hypothetical protein [Armatimonadota bacterium]